jgi:2-polyprenyl-3-methyl-5-hydroxy-6-metoxy-1,4-benzoquinol methylase
MKGYYQYLWDRCNKLPNVTNLGALGKKSLYSYMKSMKLYVYPTSFKDTSCIMALEAQACGLPFVGPRIAALPETLKDAGAILISNGSENKVNKKKFIKSIRWLLSNENPWRALHNKALKIHQPWSGIAEKWTNLFSQLLEEKSLKDKNRLYAHFEKNSDIVAMMKAGATTENWPSLKENYSFFLNKNFKEHYEKYYEYERNRGVNYGPEDLSGQPRFECTCNMIKEIKPKTVLDYGCAHGHYIMNLAKRFPDISFIGIDLEQTNIDKAKEWAKQQKIDNRCKFCCFDINASAIAIKHGYMQAEVNSEIHFPVDVILCQELLEHTPNPIKIISELSKFLDPNGKFIISVPYGPWEALGYDQHKGWRAHIHMLERADLLELFGKQKDYKIMALPHRNKLGHYLLQFGLSDNPIGEINYNRKIKQQAPRQTLSVCIIAKDAEFTLGKTLKSIKSIADEIIVGIDETTTDKTEDIAKAFNAKTFSMKSPFEIGFDACRNLTIERATCDWIMWIDADETFEQIHPFDNFLRENPYNGYSIYQHHYAVEPASLFRSDLPVRVFRNHLGMKFFGFVHEHPELEYNKGPGKVILIADCGIMHIGYPTETVRRKRFDRNFPLLIKDRDKYPDRILGNFLWCRDLAHYIKYTLERNGGRRTPDVIEKAEMIIDTWRKLLNISNVRLTIEGLAYYSEAVKLIGNGINYTISLGSCPLGRELGKLKEVKGTFIDTKDIKNVTDMLLKHNISIYDEAYY